MLIVKGNKLKMMFLKLPRRKWSFVNLTMIGLVILVFLSCTTKQNDPQIEKIVVDNSSYWFPVGFFAIDTMKDHIGQTITFVSTKQEVDTLFFTKSITEGSYCNGFKKDTNVTRMDVYSAKFLDFKYVESNQFCMAKTKYFYKEGIHYKLRLQHDNYLIVVTTNFKSSPSSALVDSMFASEEYFLPIDKN